MLRYMIGKDAADSLINLLIDHNYDSVDIKAAFKGDRDIIDALKFYTDQQDEEYDDEDEEDSYEDDWD